MKPLNANPVPCLLLQGSEALQRCHAKFLNQAQRLCTDGGQGGDEIFGVSDQDDLV